MVRPLYSGPRWRVRSAAHLEDAIQRHVGAWNADCHPSTSMKNRGSDLGLHQPRRLTVAGLAHHLPIRVWS